MTNPPPPPTALTREQVEQQRDDARVVIIQQGDEIAALRLTIDQLQKDCNHQTRQRAACIEESFKLKQTITRLERERDEAVRMMRGVIDQLKIEKADLAASQARVSELEKPRFEIADSAVVDYLENEVGQLWPMLGVESAIVTDLSHVGDFPDEQLGAEKYIWQAAIDLLRKQVAQLQARCREMEAELIKWQQPFDADMLKEVEQQASHGDSLAAQRVYIAALEHGLKQLQARVTELEEESDIWEKSSLTKLVTDNAQLQATLAARENELCTAKDQIPPDMDGDSLSVALIKLKDQRAAREARIEAQEAALINYRDMHKMECSKVADLKAERDTAVQEVERLKGALRAILNADERGQGLPFKEAMDRAAQILLKE